MALPNYTYEDKLKGTMGSIKAFKGAGYSWERNLIKDLYDMSSGAIPIDFHGRDAVRDGNGRVTALPNAGGAGAYFNGTAGGPGIITVSEDRLVFPTSNCWIDLANAADLDGVRLFVVARREGTQQRRIASMETGTVGDGDVSNDRMIQIVNTTDKSGNPMSAFRMTTGLGSNTDNLGIFPQTTALALYEIQKVGRQITISYNGGSDQVFENTVADGPFLINRLFAGQATGNSSNFIGDVPRVLSLIVGKNMPRKIKAIRRELAYTHDFALE